MELKDAKYIFDAGFNIALRSKMVTIPIFGSYMDVVYTESMQAIKEMAFRNSLEELDEKKIDKEYLNSLEFLNLLVRTYKMALDEIEMDKIIFFCNFINSTSHNFPKKICYYSIKLSFSLTTISNLSINFLKVSFMI